MIMDSHEHSVPAEPVGLGGSLSSKTQPSSGTVGTKASHPPATDATLSPTVSPSPPGCSALETNVRNENISAKDEETVEYTDRVVHRGTSMDRGQEKPPRCKYCLIRLMKLRELEKAAASHSNPSSSHTSSTQMPTEGRVDRGCQTSASLFEEAQMTRKEVRCFMLVLRYRNGKPLKTETFCTCVMFGRERDCRCGEDDKYFEWLWDAHNKGDAAYILDSGQVVMFHKDYSCGTTAIRGEQRMEKDQYFWEIKMTTPVYGTDMMVGVGTSSVELNKFHNAFCSMLGADADSWGMSYDGRVQHNCLKTDYCGRFGQGAIIGVHLDMWHGTVTFFKNRRCLGVAFRGLRGRTLYPMACSTAARSAMKIVSSRSFPTSLQYLCCRQLRKLVPPHLSVLDVLKMPPGLRAFLANNMAWLLQVPPQLTRRSNPTSASSPGNAAAGSSSDYICKICFPLKNLFEGYTDEEGESSDEDHVHNVLNFLDSEDEEDSEEGERDDWSPAAPLPHQQPWPVVRSPRSQHTPSMSPPGFHTVVTSSTSSGSKRSKLDLSASTSNVEEKEEEEEGKSEESEGNISERSEGEKSSLERGELADSEGSSPSCTLGKRKRQNR